MIFDYVYPGCKICRYYNEETLECEDDGCDEYVEWIEEYFYTPED